MSKEITFKDVWETLRAIDTSKIEVQKSGLFNMYSPRAREMTNLSEEQWSRIMKEYTKLNEAWGKDD